MFHISFMPLFTVKSANPSPINRGAGNKCLGLLALSLILFGLMPSSVNAAAETLTTCPSEAAPNPPTDMTISYGYVVDCNLDNFNGDTDSFRFEGAVNSVVVLSFRSNITCCTEADIFKPGFQPGDAPLLTLTVGGGGILSKQVTLPVNGTYFVLVKHNTGAQGSYRLGLERLSPASPTARTINFGLFSENIDPILDQDFYTFDGSKDDFIAINSTVGMLAKLYGPDQSLLGTVSGATSQQFTLPLGGQYTIHVYQSSNNQTLGYSLNLVCIFGSDGSNKCGPPSPALSCNGSPLPTNAIIGTPGNDTLIGTSGDDVIVGLGGHDRISGLAGNDVICGDSDQGGAGNDSLFGGDGDDTLLGGDGINILFGDAGNDSLKGGNNRDGLYGGADDDTLSGQANDDVLIGGYGNDKVNGDAGTRDICDKAADDLTPAKGCEFKDAP